MTEPPRVIPVQLEWDEMRQAATVGVMRFVAGRQMGLPHALDHLPNYTEEQKWGQDITGALGECVAAKALGIYWSGAGQFKAPDVGVMQVRATTNTTGRLYCKPDDDDDDVFILVRGRRRTHTVVGWACGREVKQQPFWMDPSGLNRPGRFNFFLPNERLHDMGSLPVGQGGPV